MRLYLYERIRDLRLQDETFKQLIKNHTNKVRLVESNLFIWSSLRDIAAYRFLYDVCLELLPLRRVVAVFRIGPIRVIAQYCRGSLLVNFLAWS